MNLQPKRETISGQKEFLNTTQGLIHKVGGVTLDGSTFTAGEFVKAGTALSLGQNGATKAVAWADANGGTITAGNEGTPYILANDVKVPEGGGDVVAGVLEAGFLKSSVVTDAAEVTAVVTTSFIDLSNGRFHLR